jgi:hypothetical protein
VEGSQTVTTQAPGIALEAYDRGVLGELAHELSSPVSLLCVVRDTLRTGGLALDSSVERLRQLLSYANATMLTEPMELRQTDLDEPVRRAVCCLERASACMGGLATDLGDASAPLPADPTWRDTLLAAWIETASYGAPTAPVTVVCQEDGFGVCLTATSEAELRRDPVQLLRRLSVHAGTHLAGLCGGRFVASASNLQAALILPWAGPAVRFAE